MSTTYDLQQFNRGLVEHGLILPSGVNGAYGRGTVFEDILRRFDELVMRATEAQGAQELNFPPILPRTLIEQLGYMDNFPQLAGSVHAFRGGDSGARELSARIHAGERWEGSLEPTDVMLVPAACYPVYPCFSGLLPQGGRHLTMLGWVYRHEPSEEPTRLQSYRIREFVRMGKPDEVVAWRDAWLQRGLELLRGLGLPAQSDVAADPFFGRVGKMMAAQQVDQRLKFEILVPVVSAENPTALCSFNWHQDHFTSLFRIRSADESPAHTACLGFGLERVTLALLKTHGFEPDAWPQDVRGQLWP